jgi:hypothetical protein
MYPTPYVASLRVFEPLEAFDPVDRLRWQNLVANHNSREEEQRLALERIIFPQPPSARPDGVHILAVVNCNTVLGSARKFQRTISATVIALLYFTCT